MKQYRNKITGRFLPEGGSIMIMRNGVWIQVFNPSEKLLKKEGFEVYEAPSPSPQGEETEQEKTRRRMKKIKQELRGMDYLTSKALDGEDMSAYDERYGGDWKAYRRGLREEYGELESKMRQSKEE